MTLLEEKILALEEELKELKEELIKRKQSMLSEGNTVCYVQGDGDIQTAGYFSLNNAYHYALFNNYNVFKKDPKTKTHLEWYRDNVIKVHNRLMQLHEQFCPNYFPDWKNSSSAKYTVCFSTASNRWIVDFYFNTNYFSIYFPSEEIAQTVSEILNEEKFMFKEENKICL